VRWIGPDPSSRPPTRCTLWRTCAPQDDKHLHLMVSVDGAAPRRALQLRNRMWLEDFFGIVGRLEFGNFVRELNGMLTNTGEYGAADFYR
jgi:hypothetical protein